MKMKNIIINIILLCCIALTTLNAQGNKYQDRQYNSEEERNRLVSNFRNSYEQARERIDRLQENAPLRREVTYEEEEKFLREARQILGLLEEGNYIKRSELREYERKLNDLGNQGKSGQAQTNRDNRRRNGNQSMNQDRSNRSDNARNDSRNRRKEIFNRSEEVTRSGEKAVENSRQRINEIRQKLDDQHSANKISEAEYNRKMNRVRQAEDRINNLEQRINQEKQRISGLKQQIDNERN